MINITGFGGNVKDSKKPMGFSFPDTKLCSTFTVLDETSEYAETTFLTSGEPGPVSIYKQI